MKQLTMTKVLTPLAALAFAFGVQAANPGAPDGFETQADAVVTNRTGWSFTYGSDGADDASSINTHASASVEAPTGDLLPDAFATAGAGNNYLKLSTEDGTLFRNMDGANGATVDLNAGLFVDTDVQFTVTDPTDRPTPTGEDKFIIWLEDQGTSTNLCVWAREFTVANNEGAVNSNKVYTLRRADETALAITPGLWYRLTVKALSSVGDSYTFPAFQVYLDRNPLKAGSGEYIVDDANMQAFKGLAGDDLVTGQAYFPAMTSSMSALSQVGFSGEGALDNVVVTRDVPGFENPTTITFTWDTSVLDYIANGLGDPWTTSPTVVKVYDGTEFSITPHYATGYNSNTHEISYETANVGLVGTTVTAGPNSGTVQINTEALDTVALTFNFASLLQSLKDAEAGTDFVSIVFAVNDATVATITAADLENLDTLAYTANGLKLGTNVTVTVNYAQDSGWTTEINNTGASCTSLSGGTLTITDIPQSHAGSVTIDAFKPGASINGTPYRTFAAALADALTSGTATIALAANADVAAEITSGKNITIDLAGHDITGASGAAVFTVDDGGTLTITNSTVAVGTVTQGAATAFIVNNGTLVLEAGNFGGAFSGEGTTYVNGGAYDATAFASLSGATPLPGKALADTGVQGTYVYGLVDTYTVTFDKNNASATGTMADQTFTNNVAQALTANAFALAGYTFAGWNTQADGNGTDYANGASVTLTADLTLYAKWTANNYTITFVDGETSTPVVKAYGTTIAAGDVPAFSGRTGYTAAWDNDPVGATVEGNATYTAVYTATPYTVTYTLTAESASGIGAAPAQETYYVTTVTPYTLTQPEAVEGYTFSGWYTNSTLTGDAVTTFAVDPAALENKTFYGKFTQNAVTPTVDPTNPTTPAEVKAESAAAAIEDVAIVAPAGVDAADYKALFDFSATEKPGESGTYEVTVTGIKDTVEQAVTVSAAEIVDGTSADNKVAVPAGLYYEITTMESLGGTPTVVGSGISDGKGVNVSKPGTTQGFIKVKIGTASFE